MSRRISLVIGCFLLIFIVLTVALRLIVPSFVEQQLEALIAEELDAQFIQVTIEPVLGVELLWGRIPRAKIVGEQLRVEDLNVESFHLDSREARISIRDLLLHNEFKYLGAQAVKVTAAVAEEDLNHYFWQTVDPQKNFQISLVPDRILLAGRISVFGNIWDLTLEGDLAVRDGSRLVLVPQELAIEQTRVPAVLLEVISDRYGTILDVRELAVPFEIEELEITDGRVLLYGSAAY